MALSKPPTMEELVNFDLLDFHKTLNKKANGRHNTFRSIHAPYFQKCNDDDSGDYFMFFMLKQMEDRYLSSLAMYLQEHPHEQQPSLGGKLLNLCFELRNVIHDDQHWRLIWKDNSITLYLNLYPYVDPMQPSKVDIFEIPINLPNDTAQFPFKYITVYSNYWKNDTE
jgi:hypothetical protein